MNISRMFAKDINRPVNGVVKVMQTDDESRKQELEEYVITRELQKHFGEFYDHYERGIDGETDQMGVWISGFFGSGKSHFLKILSYLLANDAAGGRHAVDYFEEKFAYDPLRYAMMRRIAGVPTETILFNIDAKSPMGKDENAILRVFTKVFYEHCGFYGDDLKIANFERFLSRRGKLDAFKRAFETINGEAWDTAREAFAFWEEDVVAALVEAADMTQTAARNWFNGEETAQISIDKLAREILEYVEGKEKNFHLVFLVDEIGQYIGDNSSLMLNLQTVVEELGAKCRGRVWVVVTSQEDIDSVTHVKGNDFSKIQGRFSTRLSLSSASVDEVIKRRILEKNEEAKPLLQLMYQQNVSALRNLFTFSGAQGDLKGYAAEEEFVDSYPFVPYQFKLLQNVLMQVRKHGSSGKHLSGGERSMLSAFKEAAERVQQRDENTLVPFYCFYDTVHTFLDGSIRRVIDRADRAAAQGNGLADEDVDVLKLLFLVRYVDEVPCNLENLTTLMVTTIQADKITMRKQLQRSLDRLVRENYVSRNGEIYLFLTDEEQDINREIRETHVDQSEIVHMIGQIVFADLYESRRFRYKNRYDFPYDPMVDHAMIGQPMGEIKLRLVTMASDLDEDGADAALLLRSGAGNEAIVRLSRENDYYHELEELLKIEKYIKQRNISQLPEAIRRIIRGKQSEAKERERAARTLLGEAIAHGSFYIAGERAVMRTSACKEALDTALSRLVEAVYGKLDMDTLTKNDAAVQQILTEPLTQETMQGVAQPNARALSDILQYMEIKKRQNIAVTVADIVGRYRAIPYGWQEIDIAALLATLVRGQKIQLISGGAPLLPGDRRMMDSLRRRAAMEATVVRIRASTPEALLKKARALAAELFHAMDIAGDEETLCGQIESLLGESRRRMDAVNYGGAVAYPGQEIVRQGETLLAGILDRRGDHVTFLEAFTRAEDELLDWVEDFGEVEFFFKNQRKIFDDAWKLNERGKREATYFAEEPQAKDALAQIDAILREKKPYRRIVELPTLMQTVGEAYERLSAYRRERIGETLVQARGDIHTLGGDYAELREEIRRADDELERRRQAASQAASPVELDAMITQILTYKDSVCRRMEHVIAELAAPVSGAPQLRIRTLRRYDVLPQKQLCSREEIAAYVAALQKTLEDALDDCDAIQMN